MVPGLINAYASNPPISLNRDVLRQAAREFEGFVALDQLEARQVELTRFNSYTNRVVNDSVTNVNLAFKNAKRGAALRKFVSFLQVVRIFGSLIQAVDNLAASNSEKAIETGASGYAETSSRPKNAAELKASGLPGSDQVIQIKPAVEAGFTPSELATALESVRSLGSASAEEKIFVVDAAQNTIERLMRGDISLISDGHLSKIEDIVLLSTLIVSGLGDTNADKFSRNNKVDLDYALDLLSGGDIASVRTDILLSIFKPQTLDDGTMFGHSARASLVRRAQRNGEKAINIRARNNGLAPVSEFSD